MRIQKTIIEGCYEITPPIFEDARGYFMESYRLDKFKEAIPHFPDFIQDNEAYSKEIGVIRGLHAQADESAQAKLVRVVKGKVLDVVVDYRKNSPSFGKHICVELSEKNKKQLLIPKGCLHGYIVLNEHTIFSYKCDNYYNKNAEISVNVNDKTLNINWTIDKENMILSDKDKEAQSWEEFLKTL
jgi:dTDP-4-dehydrorhamnose 3,5-epimerase